MIYTLGLQDLGQLTNKTEHTWKRRGAATQTSRIDYILTSADPTHAQYTTLRNWHTHLDHCMLAASIGLNKQQKMHSMKDFILGSEEFIISLGEIIEQVKKENQLQTVKLTCSLNEDDEQQAQIEDPLHNNLNIDQTIQDINTKLTQQHNTAAHVLNNIITKLLNTINCTGNINKSNDTTYAYCM